jgi:hypothetical protein
VITLVEVPTMPPPRRLDQTSMGGRTTGLFGVPSWAAAACENNA